jgi:hypothetical protein
MKTLQDVKENSMQGMNLLKIYNIHLKNYLMKSTCITKECSPERKI